MLRKCSGLMFRKLKESAATDNASLDRRQKTKLSKVGSTRHPPTPPHKDIDFRGNILAGVFEKANRVKAIVALLMK